LTAGVGAGYGAGDCSVCNWTNTEDYEPGKEYRVKVFVDDTPGDGPGGDDAGVYHCSGGVLLNAPAVTNFVRSKGYPIGNVDNHGNPVPGGWLWKSEWDSSCGQVSHLDKVTIREVVTYEPAYTSGGWHYTCHGDPPANCFTQIWADPTKGVPQDTKPIDGYMFDLHYMPSMSGTWASYCQADQNYEWATGWPKSPDPTDESHNWHLLANYTIRRYVENEGGWRYRITKGGFEHTFPLR